MRKIRMLGLLVVAAMAFGAFTGAASAGAASFTADEANEVMSTESVSEHVFSIEGSEVKCAPGGVSFSGKTAGKSYEQQNMWAASIGSCTAFGFSSSFVSTNLCQFEFKAATSGSHATVRQHSCYDATKGVQIDVNIPFIARCIVDIPEQSIANAVSYSNITSEMIRVKFTATKIMNDITTSTGFCPLKVGTNSTGTWTGESTWTSAGGLQYSP
jgi:hypothetical protein